MNAIERNLGSPTMNTRNRTIFICIFAASILFALYFLFAFQIMRWNRGQIESKTPIGSSKQDVLKFCRNEKLDCRNFNNSGFLKQETGRPMSEVGASHIEAELKNYQIVPLLGVSETAYWGFDDNGKLIEIWIWVVNDSL